VVVEDLEEEADCGYEGCAVTRRILSVMKNRGEIRGRTRLRRFQPA
jgi:hypothetical protein